MDIGRDFQLHRVYRVHTFIHHVEDIPWAMANLAGALRRHFAGDAYDSAYLWLGLKREGSHAHVVILNEMWVSSV